MCKVPNSVLKIANSRLDLTVAFLSFYSTCQEGKEGKTGAARVIQVPLYPGSQNTATNGQDRPGVNQRGQERTAPSAPPAGQVNNTLGTFWNWRESFMYVFWGGTT